MKIAQKLLLLLCFLVLFGILVQSSILLRMFKEITKKNAEAGMEKILDDKISTFSQLHTRAQEDLILVANNPIFKEYFLVEKSTIKKDLKSKIKNWLLLFSRTHNVDEINLIGNGEFNQGKAPEIVRITFKEIIEGLGPEAMRVIFKDVAPEEELSKDLSKSPFYLPSISKNKNEIYIQDPYLSTYSKTWVFGYATPIVLDDGTKPALLRFEVGLNHIQDIMTADFRGKSSRLLLINKDGLIIADSENEVKFSGIEKELKMWTEVSPEGALDYDEKIFNPRYYFSSANSEISSKEFEQIVEKINEGETGFNSFTQNGIEYFVAYRPMPAFGWSMAVISPKDIPIVASPDLLEKIEEIKKQAYIYVAVAIIMVLLLSFAFSSSITKPIKQLAQGAENISRGDLDFRINLKSVDELVDLAESFNRMTHDLKMRNLALMKLKDEISASEKKYRVLVETMNEGVWVVDNNGSIIFTNKKMEEILGYGEGELVGKNIVSFFEGENQNRIKNELEKTVKGDSSMYEIETRTKVGNQLNLLISSTPFVLEGNGMNRGYLLIVTDLTEKKRIDEEQKKLEQQLLQAEKLASMGLLAASVAHEINTPLTIISNNAQLAMKKVKDDVVIHKLGIIKEQVRTAAGIVSELLKFVHQTEPKIAIVNLNQEILKTLEILRHRFVNIKVVKELDPDLPEISADAGQLRQVFVNVITNAIQVMPNGGTLTIATNMEGEDIKVTISDTGIGILKENLHRVMNPFFTTKRVGEGTGLGLSICRGIIQRHNGTIEIESEVGIGTTVIIKLPAEVRHD